MSILYFFHALFAFELSFQFNGHASFLEQL